MKKHGNKSKNMEETILMQENLSLKRYDQGFKGVICRKRMCEMLKVLKLSKLNITLF